MTLQAAAKGLVDFREADYFDPAWNRRVSILFKALIAENDREISKAIYHHKLSLLNAPWLDESAVDELQKQVMERLEDIMAYYRPWDFLKDVKEKREQKEVRQLRDSWQKTFGSLDDPEVQAKMAAVRAALLKRAEENRPPDSPLGGQGVFNRHTASSFTALQALNRKNNGSPSLN